MYVKEMRNSQNRRKENEGDTEPRSQPSETPSGGGIIASSSEDDSFLFGYGNYGDPHSFAPYQLVLLLIDFIFNWTMDLAHEDPLAILVIFVFQSLAIIINLILYIMASANHAMQVGLHRRVTIHHWLNLGTCLLYISLTGWWFILALGKSWPSVSDQFSFTWPAASLTPVLNNNTLPLSPINNGSTRNVTRRLTTRNSESPPQMPGGDIMKEHYTLWANGFIALYVCHRVTAILYYFIYLRATFLVLNTPEIEKFVEKKEKLVEKFLKVKNADKEDTSGKGRKKRSRSILTNPYGGGDGLPGSSLSLGLHEYLAAGSANFLLENEANAGSGKQGDAEAIGNRGKSNIKKRQILWADDDGNEEVRGEAEDEPKPTTSSVRKTKTSKKSQRTRSEDDRVNVEEEEDDGGTVSRYQVRGRDKDQDEVEEIVRKENRSRKDKPRPRERTKQRKGSRQEKEEIEDEDNNYY